MYTRLLQRHLSLSLNLAPVFDSRLLSPCSGLQDLIGMYSCDCLPAFTGDDCDDEVDECLSDPCVNGGTCHVS